MFKNLLKDDAKANSSKDNGGMKQINVNSKNSNLRTVDTGGSVLLDTGEELEQADIEATKRIEGDTEIVELNSGGDSIGSSLPDTTNVNPDSPHAKKFFTDEERDEMKKYTHRFREEELQSVRKIREALDSPEWPNTREEIWAELCKREEKFGRSMDEEEELTEAEKERKMVESMQKRGMNPDYEHPENKKVENMTGKELRDILQSSGEAQEELSQAEEEIETEEEVEVNPVDDSVANLAAEAWSERGDYWEEFAEDLEVDVPNTKVESLQDSKRITTSNDSLKAELMEMHQSPDYDTQVRKEGDETIIATVPKDERY